MALDGSRDIDEIQSLAFEQRSRILICSFDAELTGSRLKTFAVGIA